MLLSPFMGLFNSVSGPALSDHFHEELVSHNGTSTAFTAPWNLDEYDTIVRIANRSGAEKWYILDGLNGYNKYISTNTDTTYTTDANVITVSGTSVTLGTTLSSANYSVTLYKAGLAGGETDTSGSITSTASAGLICSITQFTGTGANATYGHRGTQDAQIPTFIHTRAHFTGNSHGFYHVDLGNTKRLISPNTVGAQVEATSWNNTTPTSTVVSVGSDSTTNRSGALNTHYIFYDTIFSSSVSHTGNGSATGPTVSTTGQPEYLMLRRGDATYNDFYDYSIKRDATNPNTEVLRWISANGETTVGAVDLNPTGYQVKSTDAAVNANTVLYVGLAFGDFR